MGGLSGPNSLGHTGYTGTSIVIDPLSLDAEFPCAPVATSNGFAGSIPPYSAMRMSGNCAAVVKVTVTRFPFAAAATMFGA